MPVIPQFQPAAGPGHITAAMQSGVQTGLSMAERGQVARLREEQIKSLQAEEQRKRVEDEILAPVKQAKAKADLFTLNAHVQGMQRAEEMRGQAAAILPTARSEFDEIMITPVAEDREMMATAWIGKYGQLSGIAEYADEFTNKKELAATAITEARTVRELTRKTAEEKQLIAARGDAQLAVANARIAAPSKNEFMSLMTMRDQAKAIGDQESVDYYTGRIEKLNSITPQRMQKVESLLELKREAEASGDTEAASVYAKAIEKETHITQGDPLKKAIADKVAGNATPAPAPTAKPAPAPTPTAKPKAYSIEGDQVIIDTRLENMDYAKALQSAVDDGVLSEADAINALKARGFTAKK